MMNKADRTLAECKRLGLTVERTGKAWRIRGRGVDLSVLHLEHVDLSDINRSHLGTPARQTR